MPPRHAYWTIIVDDQPTSFRAHEVEELLPTFNRLREKHPSAQLRWFERGRLFESRDAAREAGGGQGERRWTGPRPDRRDEGDSESRSARRGPASERPDDTGRDKSWRPGGEHRDPRQKYKDAKKAKWQKYKQQIRSRWEGKPSTAPLPPPVRDDGEYTPPHGDPMRRNVRGREARRDDQHRDPHPEWARAPRDFRRDDRQDFRRDDRQGFRRDDRREGPRRDRRELRRDDDRRDFRRDERRPGSSSGEGRAVRPKSGGKPRPGGKRPWGSKPGGAAKRSWGSNTGGGFKKRVFGGPPRGPRPGRGPKKRRDEE